MTSSAQSSPIRVGSVYGKSGLVSTAKSTLSEQAGRLQTKHSYDLDLIDDMRAFIKAKCNIEMTYCNQLIKLVNSQANRKYPHFEAENDSDFKSLYTSWRTYLEEMEKNSKNRLAHFEQLVSFVDLLKHMRTRKVQISKKCIDQHLKKMHEEVLTSVSEIDKTRKLYFDDEHMAKQARDKEEKIKKRKTGLFSSFANLQTKKEKSSAQREASDIQSTQARNDYIMALAAGNAHLEHYYNLDIPQLMKSIDDDVLDKCRGFMLSLVESELNAIRASEENLNQTFVLVEATSADITNKAFMAESASSCLRDLLVYEFEACDGDSVEIISLDHNADLALRNEIQKWFTWFSKECRNLNRLSQQLIKCQALLSEGHKTVEVSGQSSPVDIESRIDDIKQQIRKCEISKLKARARLEVMKRAGLEMEDFENFESQITTEIKQQSLDVDIGIGLPLSRTPSLRSTNISTYSDGGRISSLDGNRSDGQHTDTDQYETPEPELNSGRSGRPESSSSDQLESPERSDSRPKVSTTSFDQSQSWTDYDPTQPAWDDEGGAAEADDGSAPQEYKTSVDYGDASVDYGNQSVDYGNASVDYGTNYGSTEGTEAEPYAYTEPSDGFSLVGKICQTLYPYESQNQDDLSFLENENLTILEALDKDWVKAQNDRYMIGFVPAAYLVAIGDAPPDSLPSAEPVQENGDSDDIPLASELRITGEGVPRTMSADTFVRAIYGYTATSEEEMSFSEGDILKLINKSDDGWWTAEKDGIVGHFPSMLVEELSEDRDSGAFAESISGESADESIESPTTPLAPPPSFAPPKPAYLTPHAVVIIQPTPEVESKSKPGDDNEEDSEHTPETDVEVIVEEVSVDIVVNPDFTLDKPTPKATEESSETISEERAEDSADNNTENMETTENIETDESEEPTSVIAQPSVTVNVQEIESTAEEISEAITMEAIQEANQLGHQESGQHNGYNGVDTNQNYCNADSDYEDLK